MPFVVGAAVVPSLGHVQLLSTTVPSNAIGAIIHASSSSVPQGGTESRIIIATGTSHLNFSNNVFTYSYGLWHERGASEVGATATDLIIALSPGAEVDLIPTTTCHSLKIENYGGGRGQTLAIWAEDLSSVVESAVDAVSVEFFTS